MASALAGILHQIQVLVSTDLLDANEHGAASWPPIQATTHNIPQRQDVHWLSQSERSYFSTTRPKPAPKTQLFRGFPPPARGKVPKLGPGVPRGVLVQQHARHRPARPLLAVRRRRGAGFTNPARCRCSLVTV